MNNLKGKTALVTGSAKNLGKAIALDLARQGAKVAIHYNSSQKEANQTLKEIKRLSAGIAIQANLTNPSDVSSMILKIKSDLGPVDILINIVGNFIFEPITKTSFEKFRDVIESNLYSTFLCSQKTLPIMIKKKWGRIINFGNVGAENVVIRKNTTPYFIAKAGVISLTKVLAYEYAKYGITVNSISPGILSTSIVKAKTPSGRFAQFSDIINVVNFFIKDESGYINGANIEVSGGWRTGF
ncbi:SDR family oxidoreductase [Patescibacteria group bacterium]|nr:SDR family oxidoreductase [Patescibacteria group bacterium]MCL5797785.1 SDR family oxidoreductase [Patescibacteria group bacterium]